MLRPRETTPFEPRRMKALVTTLRGWVGDFAKAEANPDISRASDFRCVKSVETVAE